MFVRRQPDGGQLDGEGVPRAERDVWEEDNRVNIPPPISTFELGVDRIVSGVGWVVMLAALLALGSACVIAVGVVAWARRTLFR
jgi:hypothetical protein